MPIENERKYVILESDVIEQQVAQAAEQVLRIEQRYLSIERGFSVRVRITVNNGVHSHRLTVKKDVGGQVVEIETPISEDDFRKLWPKGFNRVVKTRYIYQGWEIDFFKDGFGKNYLAIAEIELLPIQKEPDSIPNLIKNLIIFRVPIKDKRFSNKKIGNIKYATKLLNAIKSRSNAHLLEQTDLKFYNKKLK